MGLSGHVVQSELQSQTMGAQELKTLQGKHLVQTKGEVRRTTACSLALRHSRCLRASSDTSFWTVDML